MKPSPVTFKKQGAGQHNPRQKAQESALLLLL